MKRQIVFTLLRITGLHWIFYYFYQRNRVTILLYHDTKESIFQQHIEYLSRRYNFITLNRFIDYKLGKVKELPKFPMILTFDDGHKNNYRLLPIIKEKKVPITIFLVAGIIGTHRRFWFNIPLKNKRYLKKISDSDRLTVLRKEYGFKEEEECVAREALSFQEIEQMKEFVDFQSHTFTHPILPNCTDEKVDFELSHSKAMLEQILQKEIISFAYPNGSYNERDVQAVKDAGYEFAFTVDVGFNKRSTDNYRLKRISATDDSSISELAVKSTGLWWVLMKIFK